MHEPVCIAGCCMSIDGEEWHDPKDCPNQWLRENPSPALDRLIEEVRVDGDQSPTTFRRYDRVHHRHNRS